MRKINSTGTNNSQGNLWLGRHLKNELQVLDIAGNVCTYEYSCCDTNSSNEPPQLKIGYKLSTLLKSYNVTIVGELVIIVPELASQDCDQNSFENWITSNFTAPEGKCTTTESSTETTQEPVTGPEPTTINSSTSTAATSEIDTISSSSEKEGMNTTREPTTFKQNGTSTNECSTGKRETSLL